MADVQAPHVGDLILQLREAAVPDPRCGIEIAIPPRLQTVEHGVENSQSHSRFR
jgi:hypothetical protein